MVYQHEFFFEFMLLGLAEILEYRGWCISGNFEKIISHCLFFNIYFLLRIFCFLKNLHTVAFPLWYIVLWGLKNVCIPFPPPQSWCTTGPSSQIFPLAAAFVFISLCQFLATSDLVSFTIDLPFPECPIQHTCIWDSFSLAYVLIVHALLLLSSLLLKRWTI